MAPNKVDLACDAEAGTCDVRLDSAHSDDEKGKSRLDSMVTVTKHKVIAPAGPLYTPHEPRSLPNPRELAMGSSGPFERMTATEVQLLP